jgi:outer membrane protein assembly factor BamB
MTMKPKSSFHYLLISLGMLSTSISASNVAVFENTALELDPEAKVVIDAYIEATGGVEARKSIKYLTLQGTLSIPEQEHTSKLVSYSTAPNKNYSLNDNSPYAKHVMGFNGSVGWYEGTTNGVGYLEGADLAMIEKQAFMFPEIHLEEIYHSITRIEDTKDGKIALLLIDKRGYDEIWVFDPESHLITSMEYIIGGDARGDFRATYHVSNYQSFGGILLPMHVTTVNPAVTWHIELDFADVRTEIPDELYEPPVEKIAQSKAASRE